VHDDAELLRRWAAGDSLAGRRLVEANFEVIRRFFATKVPDADAEDLIQTTFTTSLETAAGYRGESGFRAYLLGIARNVLLRFISGRKRSFDPLSDSVEGSGMSPLARVEHDERRKLLLRGLRRLPLDDQIAVELYYWEGYAVTEVARVLGLSVSAGKTRLFRARRLLAELIASLESDPELVRSTVDDLDAWRARTQAQLDARTNS